MGKFESGYMLKDENDTERLVHSLKFHLWKVPSRMSKIYKWRSTNYGYRLDIQQEFINLITNHEHLHPSIPLEGVKDIADVATGTGLGPSLFSPLFHNCFLNFFVKKFSLA
jgi:hypothetical protein